MDSLLDFNKTAMLGIPVQLIANRWMSSRMYLMGFLQEVLPSLLKGGAHINTDELIDKLLADDALVEDFDDEADVATLRRAGASTDKIQQLQAYLDKHTYHEQPITKKLSSIEEPQAVRTLYYPTSYSRYLDEVDVENIATLLDTTFHDVTSFLENDPLERNFTFLLSEHSSIAVYIDHRWDPQELFGSLETVLQHQIKLIRFARADHPTALLYDITFELYGHTETFQADMDYPEKFIEFISQRLQNDKTFIYIEDNDDEFLWFLAPKSLDLDNFCTLIGARLTQDQSDPKDQQTELEHYIDPRKLVAEKLFFNLIPYCYPDNNPDWGYFYLKFSQNEKECLYASRVMPGETILEVVNRELQQNFHVRPIDWSFATSIAFSDTTKDTKGRPVQRINVSVLIPYDLKYSGLHGEVSDMHAIWKLVE